MLTAIRQWVIRTMMKAKGQTGVVQTLPNQKIIDINTQITAQKLMANGIEPNSLKNADQVENAIIAIESRPKVQEGIKSTSSAKVFDLEGKEIPPGAKIMGGKESKDSNDVNKIIADIKSMNPIDSMKEANAVIGRKGKYKDLTPEESKKILQDTEDHIFERDIKPKETDMDFDDNDFAQGGRAGYFLGGSSKAGKAFLEFMKKFKVKQSGDGVNEFLSKRKFLKDMVGNTEKNKRIRELNMLKEAMEKARKEGGYKFKDIDVDKDIRPIFDQSKDRKLNATGGRAGFRSGSGKGIMEFFENLIKPRKPKVFDKKRFEEGPIDLDFLEKLDPKDLGPYIRTRDTKGIGGYGMYENFADMPAGLRAAELIKTIKGPANKINYKAAELFLGKKLRGDESVNELLQILNRQEMRAEGGRIGYANGTPSFEDYLKERGMIEKRQRLEQLMKEFQEDMRRKKVMEQKQEAKDGGRIGYKDGPDMGRRTFLKILGGLAAVPIIGKFIKPMKVGKTIKKVPIIQTENVTGKPEWFDALVNKVIIEGDDVTKKFATGERQSIHQKALPDGTTVRVTQDVDDGAVRVEYESDANMFEDTVQMEYKKPLPDEGDPNPAAEFKTSESGVVGRADGPDDYSMDVEEVGGTSIKDLDSDVSKLKEYATGQKPTIKEIVQSKRRKDRVKYYESPEGQVDYVTTRQGDYVPEPDDFASGGIARMLGE